MSLTLHYHPLSSFCWKALIALYETSSAFTPLLVNLEDEKSRTDFLKVWPVGQFPVLRDETRRKTIPQSSAIIEYLNLHHPGGRPPIPADFELAAEVRRWDSFCDCYLHVPMQKIVSDILRPEGQKDPSGVDEARKRLRTSLGVLEKHMQGKTWIVGDSFSMADISACPALFYGNKVEPLEKEYPKLLAHLERLKLRPSFARVLEEAKPYFPMFPYKG